MRLRAWENHWLISHKHGGYPPPLLSNAKRRSIWYRDYIATLIQRDVRDIANIRNLDIFPKLLALSASQTARLFNSTGLASLLRSADQRFVNTWPFWNSFFLIEQLQPLAQQSLKPPDQDPENAYNRHGPCLLSARHRCRRHCGRTKHFGQLLETIVYQELRKHADWHDETLSFHHFRNKDKVEVDLLTTGRQLAGIEVKAATTVVPGDFKA